MKRMKKLSNHKKVKRTSKAKTAQAKQSKKNRVSKKQYNKAYYSKKKTTILKRAKEARKNGVRTKHRNR